MKDNNRVYTIPGRNITEEEVPGDVKRAFRQLAVDIVKEVEYMAKHCKAQEEEYTVTKTHNVLVQA